MKTPTSSSHGDGEGMMRGRRSFLEVDSVLAALPFIVVTTILDPKVTRDRRQKAEQESVYKHHALPLLGYCGCFPSPAPSQVSNSLFDSHHALTDRHVTICG